MYLKLLQYPQRGASAADLCAQRRHGLAGVYRRVEPGHATGSAAGEQHERLLRDARGDVDPAGHPERALQRLAHRAVQFHRASREPRAVLSA